MVVALIALFVALGGTAKALEGQNTVFSDDIVDGEVKTRDIGNGHVRTGDLANGGVVGAKVLDASLTGADIAGDSLTGGNIAAGSITGSDVASGSLTGSTIATGTLTGDDVANDTITGSDVRDLTGLDVIESTLTLNPGSVTDALAEPNQIYDAIGAVTEVPGGTAHNSTWITRSLVAACHDGNDIPITGTPRWTATDTGPVPGGQALILQSSERTVDAQGRRVWKVVGGNDSGVDRRLVLSVVCLAVPGRS